MAELKIAAQLHTVREFLTTPEDFAKSLKKVKEIGYNAIQVSKVCPVSPQELKELTDSLGLTICATHVTYDHLKGDLDAVIQDHKLWGCKYIGIGSMPQNIRKLGKEGFVSFAKEMSEIARKIADNGMRFIYHNHNFEFVKFDGLTGLDILFEESDPEVFDFEIDTYWVQAGGADPIKWIRKVKDRMKVVHFKDMVMDNERNQIMAEVGEGNLNWPGIIEACKEIGVEWCAVEQDRCQRDPFESLAISLKNLKTLI